METAPTSRWSTARVGRRSALSRNSCCRPVVQRHEKSSPRCGRVGGLLAASAHAADRPSPGAAGIGDRLFPTLGNGGYDVQHYDLELSYATAAPSQGIDGTVTITANATQALSRFDLDFAGDSVGSISVEGQPAKFSRDGQDLVITPAQPLPKGRPSSSRSPHYKAHPNEPSGSNILDNAFVITPDGSATLPQPSGAHVFLPSNDHPRDKATFTFRFDVPAGETAVANGELESQTTANGRTQFVYQQTPADGDRADPARRRQLQGHRPRRPRRRPRPRRDLALAGAAARRQAPGRDRPARLDDSARRRLPVRELRLAS